MKYSNEVSPVEGIKDFLGVDQSKNDWAGEFTRIGEHQVQSAQDAIDRLMSDEAILNRMHQDGHHSEQTVAFIKITIREKGLSKACLDLGITEKVGVWMSSQRISFVASALKIVRMCRAS
ncbi:hypothetical protein NDU88_002163 [Pleurodeles waltl]|uniref:Uncharacterized protein n=1 Tax=Pleurodeles waltl TaxID=8319 RepID=A0AAV7VBS8_PLEWA|nr:hypothetical protein NDU88_002163 [Pleurodeles waltl]